MIPKSFKDITVKDYQAIHPFVIKDDLDSWVYIVAYFLKKSIKQVEDEIEGDKLKAYFKQLSFLKTTSFPVLYKYIWIKGRLYKAVKSEKKLTAGQYVGIKTFCQQGDVIQMLPDLAACCYRKLTLKGWKYDGSIHEEIRNEMLKQPAHKILPVVFFCSKVLIYWIKDTEVYSNSQKIIAERMKELEELICAEASMIIGGGTPQLTK